MPLTADQRFRLTADTAVITGWLTDLAQDRRLWLAMDLRVSPQIFAAADPDADSAPIFDLQGATVGTSTFHGRQCIVLQCGTRQLCLGSAEPADLVRWLNAFKLCASQIVASPPLSLSRSLLRSATPETVDAATTREKGALFQSLIPPQRSCLRRLRVYATPLTMLILSEARGADADPVAYRALRFDRSIPSPASIGEIVTEDEKTYHAAEAVALVRDTFRAAKLDVPGDDGGAGTLLLPHSRQGSSDGGFVAAGAAASGLSAPRPTTDSEHSSDAVFVLDLSAILGVIQFTRGFYLVAVSRKSLAGTIGGHCIYSIAASEIIPISLEPVVGTRSTWQRLQGLLTGSDPAAVAEGRYHSLLLNMDLTKDFFFSYTCVVGHGVCRAHGFWQFRGLCSRL
jgi:hypothetical protein